MNCKNCNVKISGNFCSNCGQKINTDRINFKYLINEINTTIFQLDHGFFYTIKQLTINPGNSIREFIEGRRKRYFKPIAFVLILSTIYALIASLVNEKTFLEDFLEGWKSYDVKASKYERKTITSFYWLVQNYAYAILVLLPIFSLASFLAFKRKNYNYFEHLVLNSFITGQQAVIYIVYIILQALIGHVFPIEAIYIYFVIGYVFWVYIQFFKETKKLKTILLTFVTYFYYTIIISLLISVLSLVINKFIS